jgi:AMMECR1 domain-containing protein
VNRLLDEPEACRIARHALRSYFFGGVIDSGPDIAPPGLAGRAAVFVFLWAGPDLRGCMGTVEPLMPSAAREIAVVALQAATADPCRRPVHASEVDALHIGVSVLGDSRHLRDGEDPGPAEALEIRPEHESGSPSSLGLVLPGCGGEPEARRAAGIPPDVAVLRAAVSVTAFGRQLASLR